MKQARMVTEGAVLLASFVILLLITLYIPVVGSVVNLFLPLPFIFFSIKNDWKASVVFFISSVLLSFIVGTILAIPLAIMYGMTGIVMGSTIRNNKSRSYTYIVSSLIFLLNIVGTFIVSVVFFNINYITETFDILRSSIDQMTSTLSNVENSSMEMYVERLKESLQLLETLIPSMFVMTSLTIVFFIQLVSIPILRRFRINVGNWKPFRELVLPKSLLWYFLIILVLSYFLHPEKGSFGFIVLVNLVFMIQFIIALQGLSFVYYFTHMKGLPKALPVIITILVLSMPFILSIVRILGIMDLGFDLRKYVSKKNGNT